MSSVANHPYGVLDGIVMAWLVSKVRSDFVVLTHIVLTRAPEAAGFILPVDFSGTEEAERINLASRAAARAQLAKGGAVVVFPAGAISTTPDKLGLKPAVDGRWQPFVSQLIQRSKATVIPIWFGGQNSRLFQIASHVSATLRLSLIFHEVKARIGATLPVVVGAPLPFASIAAIRDRQALADDLRARVYALARYTPSIGKPRRPVGKLLRPKLSVLQRTARRKGARRSPSGRLVHVGEQSQVFLDHAPREFCDIGLIEIVRGLEIDFLNVQELPVSFDFIPDVIAIELGPGF